MDGMHLTMKRPSAHVGYPTHSFDHSVSDRETKTNYLNPPQLEHWSKLNQINSTCDVLARRRDNNNRLPWQPFLFTQYSPHWARMACWHSSSFDTRFYSAATRLVPISTTMKSLLFWKRQSCLFPTWRTASRSRLGRCFTQLPRGGRGDGTISLQQRLKATILWIVTLKRETFSIKSKWIHAAQIPLTLLYRVAGSVCEPTRLYSGGPGSNICRDINQTDWRNSWFSSALLHTFWVNIFK